jgi:hypothetical protein
MNTYRKFLPALFLALSACAAVQKPSGQMDNTVEAEATVVAIDKSSRVVTLEGDEGGDWWVIEAGPEVRNLDQVEVGDKVKVSYTEALMWQVKKASQGAPGVVSSTDVERAQAGQKPGGTVGREVTVTTTITAIDLPNGTVTLTGPRGHSQTVKAADMSNLRKVQVGDLVDITYREAVAVAVKPAGK